MKIEKEENTKSKIYDLRQPQKFKTTAYKSDGIETTHWFRQTKQEKKHAGSELSQAQVNIKRYFNSNSNCPTITSVIQHL